jgi:hypothetical protein
VRWSEFKFSSLFLSLFVKGSLATSQHLPLVNLLRSLDGERSPIAGIWHEIKELSRFLRHLIFLL